MELVATNSRSIGVRKQPCVRRNRGMLMENGDVRIKDSFFISTAVIVPGPFAQVAVGIQKHHVMNELVGQVANHPHSPRAAMAVCNHTDTRSVEATIEILYESIAAPIDHPICLN
ncbi:MAG: hypothetical protein Q8Q32_01485 [bacterium]|nr:hypothetical protein [bacterium]